MMDATRYVRALVLTTTALLAAAAAFNVAVDPYGVFDLPTVQGVNDNKVLERRYSRLYKSLRIGGRHFDGIVIGTSRIDQGIDPDYAALKARGIRLYNFGINGFVPAEIAPVIAYARHQSGIRFAIVSLDFVRYGWPPSKNAVRPGWNYPKAVWQLARMLVSVQGLRDSVETVHGNLKSEVEIRHLPSGRLNIESQWKISRNDLRDVFDSVDRQYLNLTLRPYLGRSDNHCLTRFDHAPLRAALETARRLGVTLHFFVPPSHARQMVVLDMLGLTPLFERWKLELVRILADDGRKAGAPPFPLWDFSGYNAVTMEPVPPAGDKNQSMTYYHESVHFTQPTGRAILNRVLDLGDPDFSGLDDFGLRLEAENIIAYLRAIRRKGADYRQRYPEVVAGLAALYDGSPLRATDQYSEMTDLACGLVPK